MDDKLIVDIGVAGEKCYLVSYFRKLAYDDESTNKLDPSRAISIIRSDKDELMEGIEVEERLRFYKKHFDD